MSIWMACQTDDVVVVLKVVNLCMILTIEDDANGSNIVDNKLTTTCKADIVSTIPAAITVDKAQLETCVRSST